MKFLFRTLLVAFLASVSFAQVERTGKVIGISDGDTIRILEAGKTQITVRLSGIDAPEKRQPFGQKSKANLSSLIFGEVVTFSSSKVDRYGRVVAKVLFDGEDINLQQIEAGLAWHYKDYAKEQSRGDRKLYADAETEARSLKDGLWRDATPLEPWVFRKEGKTVSVRAGTLKSVPTIAPNSGAAVKGNRNSMIYHLPGCRDYTKISPKNIVWFRTGKEAEAAGYRVAKNCL